MSEKWKAADIPSLAGKRVLITGANSGIGYHAALKLARKGAHVMLASRDRQRGEAALARLDADAPSAVKTSEKPRMNTMVAMRTRPTCCRPAAFLAPRSAHPGSPDSTTRPAAAAAGAGDGPRGHPARHRRRGVQRQDP